jgi:hypothetical protein
MNLKRGTLILAGIVICAILIAGCTSSKTVTTTVSASVTTPAAATTAAPVAAATTPTCPDKEVLTGNWDSRELSYASNHDIRQIVWNDEGPVPVSLIQTCWDATGTYRMGDCDGKLTGKIEKNVFSGHFTLKCANTVDSSSGTFSVTMAADNQSFLGSMYSTKDAYGPEAGFPPGWWGKKTV